ncbi:TonB-dependent receptor [Pseudoxanthomonas sacheonensis]|nr:TonB-dependent receptor [Pseudoxanthomonas sacheonensis]
MSRGIQVSPKRCRLSAALLTAILLPAAGSAFAQQADAKQEDKSQSSSSDSAVDLDKVVVTGSRISRSQLEGPSPVTVISTAQIEKEGFVSVNDALKTITQNFGAVQNELNSAGGFTPNGSVVNLRGLGPGRTLLLINGRRAADYPFPYNGQSNFQNFGNIPTAAVDRIEILSGGASAIYGSDAVAGVVNVILKTNYEGDVLKLRTGTLTTGGGDFADFQWVGGKTGENWSITYALEKFNDETVYAYQRDFMDSRADNPLPDVTNTLPAQPVGTLRIARSAGGTNSIFTPPAGTCERFNDEYVTHTFRTVNATTGVVTTTGTTCGYWNDVGYQSIANGNDDWSGYLYGTYNFDNGIEAWASLQGYHSKSDLTGGLETFLGAHIDGTGTVGTIFATNPGINANVTLQRIFTPQELGGVEATLQKFTEKSLDAAFGLRGTIFDRFDWDFTIGRAEYQADRTRPRFDGSAVTEWFLGPRLNTTGTPRYLINLDRWYSPLTPEQYRSLSTILKYEAKSWVNQGSFVISGDLFNLPAGPVGFAATLEGTQQGYKLRSPEGILPTNRTVYNLTGTNGGGDRDRYAIGAEFRVPVFSMLDLSLSGRLDKYDDITQVDDAKTWGAGLEFRPLDSLLFRGNYSTSFKAPDMHFIYNEGSGSFTNTLDTYRCLNAGLTPGTPACAATTYTYSMFATSRGEPSLEEETGKSWSAGVVWDIIDGMSVSVDYYDIRLKGAVTTLSSTYIIDAEGGCRTGLTRTRQPYPYALDSGFCQEILSRVTREVAPGEPTDRVTNIRSGPVNQAYQRVTGIDAAFKYRLDTDRFGDFGFDLAWTHTLKSQRQPFATDALEEDWRDDLSNFDFRSRVRGSVAWSLDDWSANVFATRYGSLPNWQETGRIAPYVLWNLNVSKQITEKMEVSLFVNNVFNKFHPKDSGFNTYPYFWRAYSPLGREISAQVEYKFN